MNRSSDRILTTHAGSIVRTDEILKGMKARTLGEPLDEERLQETISAGIADVVRRQIDAGIDIPNDGEYARRGFKDYLDDRIGGAERVEVKPGDNNPSYQTGPNRERDLFPGFTKQYHESVEFAWIPPDVDMSKMVELRRKKQIFRLLGPLHYSSTEVQRDIANLRAALDGHEVTEAFITAAPPTTERQHAQYSNVLDFYPSFEAYQYALADVMREEYKAIIDAGFILQLDRPAVDATYHLETDEEIAKALDAGIEIENYALRDIPEERVRLHWCGGASNRPHINDIPLGKVVKSMLKLNVGAYGFEAASPRHEHEFKIWEDIKLPEGKIIVPGLISQSTNVVEHPELIAWRIKNFANLVGRENVIAGVDCGFCSSWDLPRVHSEVQWAKLQSLAEGAAIASEELWRKSSTA